MVPVKILPDMRSITNKNINTNVLITLETLTRTVTRRIIPNRISKRTTVLVAKQQGFRRFLDE